MIDLHKNILKGTSEEIICALILSLSRYVLIGIGLAVFYIALLLLESSILNEWIPYYHLPNSRLILALNDLGLIVFN